MEAQARGDQCYAIRDDNVLAAYGWYSFGYTPIGLPGLVLNFSPYKGFTDSRYRGQRLHAVGNARAGALPQVRLRRHRFLRRSRQLRFAQILLPHGVHSFRLDLCRPAVRPPLLVLQPWLQAIRFSADYSFSASWRRSAGTRGVTPARSS